jgi:aldose 1-epimerase
VPIVSRPFGRLPDGRVVDLYTLTNSRGVSLDLSPFGGTVVSLRTPDRRGVLGDVVLGFETLDEYLARSPYFGCIVGRFSNRIGGGTFTLDGIRHQLTLNDGNHHLHGGRTGWDKKLWTAVPFVRADRVGVVLSLESPHGDEGYPGTMSTTVTYTLSDAGTLAFAWEATTDRPTIVSLAHHSYFDLSAGRETDILSHELELFADEYTPVDRDLIPLGTRSPVDGTPFDFRMAVPIGRRIGDNDEQIARGRGYDHNMVVRRARPGLARAARVVDPRSGRSLIVTTSLPGLQFYSGNFLDGTLRGKGGRIYHCRSGFCLEAQAFPDAPNHRGFPLAVLRPNETYRALTTYVFGVDGEAA